MAVQKGKDLLVKLDATGTGTYTTVAGLKARRLAFNTDSVDVTDSESAGRWRELLSGAGVRRASVSGTGIFRDQTSDAYLRQMFFDGTTRNLQIVVPDFGTVAGPFQITSLDYAGDHDGEATFEIALDSAGALTFTAL